MSLSDMVALSYAPVDKSYQKALLKIQGEDEAYSHLHSLDWWVIRV